MSKNDEERITERGWSAIAKRNVGFQFIRSDYLWSKYVPVDYSNLTPVSDEIIDRVLNSIKKDGTDVVHSSGEPKTDLNSD